MKTQEQIDEEYMENILKSSIQYTFQNVQLSDTGIQFHGNTIPYWAIASTEASYIPEKNHLWKIVGFGLLAVFSISSSLGLAFFFVVVGVIFKILERKKIYLLKVVNNAQQSKYFSTDIPADFTIFKNTIDGKIESMYARKS